MAVSLLPFLPYDKCDYYPLKFSRAVLGLLPVGALCDKMLMLTY